MLQNGALLLLFSLLITSSWSCNDYGRLMEQQVSIDNMYPSTHYNGYSWWSPYLYQSSPRFSEHSSEKIESRSSLNRLYPSNINQLNEDPRGESEGRFFLRKPSMPYHKPLSQLLADKPVIAAELNNKGQFLSQLLSYKPILAAEFNKPFQWISSQNNPFNANPVPSQPSYKSCSTTSGLVGFCTPSTVCSYYGGMPTDSCINGGTCCVNIVKSCGSVITSNYTYWQSPAVISSGSVCPLTIRLNSEMLGAGAPSVVQVRLDFITFSIGQPGLDSVCSTDTFSVSGSSNSVPIICGDNAGQHMYLTLPTAFSTLGSTVSSIGGGLGITGGASGESDLQLFFTFGQSTTPRSWNIRISMLPNGANYLAPGNVLQYYTGSSGTVSSFNFALQGPSATAVRQLAYQKYNIGFRSEAINGSTSNSICFAPCTSAAFRTASGFSLTGDATSASAAASTSCTTDFLTLLDQSVSVNGVNTGLLPCDRMCGVMPFISGQSICSTVQPYRFYYQTDGNEIGDTGNNGFCFNYQQAVVY